MIVKYYDPYLPDGVDKALGLTRCESLESLLEQSFVVSPHCPLTPETHHMLNVETIAKMPRGSFLVNTSRGGVVDEHARQYWAYQPIVRPAVPAVADPSRMEPAFKSMSSR